ncbi:MAG: Wzz/FepE/Etk N-terminal domain-containing protein, partial [Acidobacteriota bacterium]
MDSSTSSPALAIAQPNEVETLSENGVGEELVDWQGRQRGVARARLLWERRRFLFKMMVWGLASAAAIAFVIPNRYESTVRLMPPDGQSGSGLAMLAALTAKTGSGLEMLAGDLLGVKNSGAHFAGILRSRTVQERLVDRFDLRKIYWVRRREDARKELAHNTEISEDRKSG